jgi:hypothetical protein
MTDQEHQDMDVTTQKTASINEFLTPPRILIPKLVRSRDQWKDKATKRKRQYRKEKIRSRDLSLSRQRWKARALAAAAQLLQLQQELERAQADLALAHAQIAQLQTDAKKN